MYAETPRNGEDKSDGTDSEYLLCYLGVSAFKLFFTSRNHPSLGTAYGRNFSITPCSSLYANARF